MSSAKNQKEPLKESVDYPDFVAKFVKDRIAALDKEATAELVDFIAQDVEGYLLDVKKSPEDLTKVELAHINDFIRERVENGLGGLA
jgi:hypothetical protein